MKFTELKQSLKENIKPVYLLVGNDIFLINKAEELIRNALCQEEQDLDVTTITVEDSFDVENLTMGLSSFSMLGGKRIFVLKNAQKIKQAEVDKLNKFLESEITDNILIIVDTFSSLDNYSRDTSAIYKTLQNSACVINCNHLEFWVIEKLILKHVTDSKKQMDMLAVKTLVDFCTSNLAQIYMELDKLIVIADGNVINQEMVEKNVEKNEEYAFFELANCLAEKNKDKAIKIATKLIDTKQTGGIIGSIYNQFARMFFVSVNTGTDEELAKSLGVKPYSITLAKKAGRNFTQRELRNILKIVSSTELATRQGDLKEDVAVLNIVLEILKG